MEAAEGFVHFKFGATGSGSRSPTSAFREKISTATYVQYNIAIFQRDKSLTVLACPILNRTEHTLEKLTAGQHFFH